MTGGVLSKPENRGAEIVAKISATGKIGPRCW